MSKQQAQKEIKQAMSSGYRHHAYALEKQMSDYIFRKKGDISVLKTLTLETYSDVLGPEKKRAAKNSLICLVAILSRSAIEYGVDAEQSFTLSDYYINEIESTNNVKQLQVLQTEILEHYSELALLVEYRSYSLHITRAIHYINQHLYESCPVTDTAGYVNLNPQYFAVLFKKEVGMEPSAFIRKKKMEEARELLMQTDYTVMQISEMLAYCSPSYFVKEFKKTYGQTPKQFTKP